MAIDTDTKKLAIMEWCSIWEPGLPLSPGTIGQAEKQHFLWGYSGIIWGQMALFLAASVNSPDLASTVNSPDVTATVRGM